MDKIQAAQRDHGVCIVGLSGGRTPRPIYELLASSFQLSGSTSHVKFFLVDERCVPPDHPESNQRLVRETLLAACHAEPVEARHVVFPNTALPINDCMADYTRRLKELWKDRLPDLVILGMGTDGHTASLFPPLSDLPLGDGRLVLHTKAPEGIGPPSARDRITLSLNALSAAGEQVLLLQGKEKQKTWEEMMASSEDERRWPLKRIMETGNLAVIAER